MGYPRVLIVYHSCINKADPHGVSLRNWFADWPKERLAQIYSGNEVGLERFCGHTFRLGVEERRFGRLFFSLKDSSLGQSNAQHPPYQGVGAKPGKRGFAEKLKHGFSSMLIRSGLWELIFYPVISPRMVKWISDFGPDVIYSQGYLLSFAWLAVSLQRSFNIPSCYHAVDDWPRSLYRNGMFSWFVRPIVGRAVKQLLLSSSVRFSIGERMATEYHIRYGLEIEPLMICDQIERFDAADSCRLVKADFVSIVYTGGLGHYRWQSIVDLSHACESLGREGFKIRIAVYATSIPSEATEALHDLSNVQFQSLPSHDDLPRLLKSADILFLPETFDRKEADAIRLSVSTKAPLYMMSGRPILAYGSPVAGVIDYAEKSGWGYVVGKQGADLLAGGIRRIQGDMVLRARLVARGLEVAKENHEGSKVRGKLLVGLLRAANAHPSLQEGR